MFLAVAANLANYPSLANFDGGTVVVPNVLVFGQKVVAEQISKLRRAKCKSGLVASGQRERPAGAASGE